MMKNANEINILNFNISKDKLIKLLAEIPRYINENEDSVRLYQIKGKGNVTTWGKNENYDVDEVIIL